MIKKTHLFFWPLNFRRDRFSLIKISFFIYCLKMEHKLLINKRYRMDQKIDLIYREIMTLYI